MTGHRPTLADWLAFDRYPNVTKARWLGGLISVVGSIVVLMLGALTVFRFFMAVSGIDVFEDAEAQSAAIRNNGLVIAAMIGVPFLIWRTSVAQKQVLVAEQGMITDRINKAVDGLGADKSVERIGRFITVEVASANITEHRVEWNHEDTIDEHETLKDASNWQVLKTSEPNLEVRTGAIFALERIAKDSPRDHIQIMEILCTYVRENAPALNTKPTEFLYLAPKVRSDIQTAILVLSRRTQEQRRLEAENHHRLDLRGSNLSGVNFHNGNFSGALFYRCRLEAANFRDCNLSGARFYEALLNWTSWYNADLTGVRFDRSILNRPSPMNGGYNPTISVARSIKGCNFAGANLSAVDHLGKAKDTNDTFGTLDTKLHEEIDERRKAVHKDMKIALLSDKDTTDEKIRKSREAIEKEGFLHWSPNSRDDDASSVAYYRLLVHLGLNKFPFTNAQQIPEKE